MTQTPDGDLQQPLEAEVQQLRREKAFLLKRVSAISLLQRQLANSNHLLDKATRRFKRMQIFMRRGIQCDSSFELNHLVCESVIDILECEISLLLVPERSGRKYRLIHSPGFIPGPQFRRTVKDWLASFDFTDTSPNARLIPPSLNLREALVEPVRDASGSLTATLVAANSWDKGVFHDTLEEAEARTFAAFAEQVGTLMESRRRGETILGQIQKIRHSEERLALAIESSNVGLWDWNCRSNRVIYSSQWKRQLGYTEDEITTRFTEWTQRLHPDDRDRALTRLEKFLYASNDDLLENTFRLRHKNGSWRWFTARGFAMRDTKGQIRRVIGTHIDITSHKELEEDLRAAKDQAERASQAKSDFLAKVSHEIRTPLNGMLAAFQLLREQSLNEEQRRLIKLGETSGRWLMEIIGDSLDIARIEARRLELRIIPFSPRRLLSDLVLIMNRRAISKGLRLHSHIDPAIPERLLGDPGRIQQIIANLVGNAIKFTQQGSVRIDLQMRRSARIGREFLQIVVSDTGSGVPENLRDEIFKPFEQAHPNQDAQASGIGLGLAIARELVHLMGGTIRLAKSIGQGSHFITRIPLKRAPEPDTAIPSPYTPARRFSGRVLLVEDDLISRELTTLMIGRLGVQVDSATNGIEGLELLLDYDYDLAIVDCWMPRLNGIEMTRRLRQEGNGKRHRTPIVALTANTEQSSLEACLTAGMNECLTKPLVEELLIQCLTRYLPAPHPPTP